MTINRQTVRARAIRKWEHTFPMKLWSLNVTERTNRFTIARKAKLDKKIGRAETLVMLNRARPTLPLKVTITRISPRALDRHDNLPAGCKHLVDGISGALGVDDAQIRWEYAQEKGKPHQVRIEIEETI